MTGPEGYQVYVALGSVDMRKSIDTLAILVSQRFELDPFSGHMFAFSNRKRTVVKVLYWDRNGFCLWQKRLEKHRFRWPECREDVLRISGRELRWLLDGLEINQARAHKPLEYSLVC